MAHRWNLPKVAKWEVKYGGWNVMAPDLLVPFLSTLPRPLEYRVERATNKHGQEAEIHVLKLAEKIGDGLDLWHGTTFHAIASILTEGLKESNIAGVHEFTTPGIYCADHIDCSLYYHATATKMVRKDEATDTTPYTRSLLKVESIAPARKISSYGAGRQHVFSHGGVHVLEIHVYRGWHFIDSGEKVIAYIDEDMADGIEFPNRARTPPCPPPVPPPITWVEYMYDDVPNKRKVPYYACTTTGKTQWEKPNQPFVAFQSQTAIVEDSWSVAASAPSLSTMEATKVNAMPARHDLLFRGDHCCLCNLKVTGDHIKSKRHRMRLAWWANASENEREEWCQWTLDRLETA